MGVGALNRATSNAPLLLGLDLDGTLAPLCDHPDQVKLPDEVLSMLLDLEQHCYVAILSGRSRKNLQSLCGALRSTLFIGNHGIECPWTEPAHTESAQALCQSWSKQLHRAELPEGTWIEDKEFGLSFHYRQARDADQAASKLRQLILELQPVPRIISGKYVLNAIPAEAPDKGDALMALDFRYRPEGIIYIGDDITDEMAFRVLQRSDGAPDKPCLGIRVGQSSQTAASYYIQDQSEVPGLLRELLVRITRHSRLDPL